MCRAARAPTALVLLLPLLLGPPSARGDCGLPPEVPNAEPNLQGQTSFPNGVTMTYKCVLGFVKVPGRPDSTLCAQDQWSQLTVFCNRSCDVPTRLFFASLQKTYSGLNYFPVGSSVEYECREGFQRVESLSRKISCLQNLMWSKAEEFCKKKSCPNPGEIKNGHISVITDILYGATITFSCDAGYNLVGADSSYCTLLGDTVGWTHPLPDCKVIVCPKPPQIDHAVIEKLSDAYLYGHSVLYQCTAGFDLVGNSAVNCTAEAGHGVWSSPLPVCRETPSAGQNPVMANFSASQTTSTTQRSTTATVSLAQSLPAIPTSTAAHARVTQGLRTTQRLTSAHVTATQRPVAPRATTHIQTTSTAPARGPPFSRASIIAFALTTLVRTATLSMPCFMVYLWLALSQKRDLLVNRERTQMYDIDSFACVADNHGLAADSAQEELRSKCTVIFSTFLVS